MSAKEIKKFATILNREKQIRRCGTDFYKVRKLATALSNDIQIANIVKELSR